MLYRLFALACALVILPACDAGDPDGSGSGTGTHALRTEGAYAETLSGRALFAPALYDGQASFSLQFQTTQTTPNVLIALDWGGSARPAAGTYTPVDTFVGSGSGRVRLAYVRSSSNPFSYESFQPTGGTVTLTESSANRIAGTLSVDLAGAGRTLRLTGTFSATPGH